jgi:hypothetical protein
LFVLGKIEIRADWNEGRTWFFVSILKEYNSPRYRAQNGWTKEAWNSMTQRINEELEAYKELTKMQLHLKSKQIEQSNPINDPFSMSKCMLKLKSLPLTQTELLKTINFLKGDKEAREIFICCEE